MIELLPLFVWVVYFVPFMVAATRNHEATTLILIANVLLAWTGIGWIAVFLYAWYSPAKRAAPRGPAVVIPFPEPGERRSTRHRRSR